MEKYGYVPEENENLDEILKLFEGAEDVSVKEMRENLRKDEAYAENFSTVKQQQYLHIIFEKLGIDLKDFLEENFEFRSTKLLYKSEISNLIDQYKHDYDMILNEENR